MEFDWRSIAGAVAPHAPKIGAVLGSAFGPFGGIIGGFAGNALAAAFGVEATPEAIGKAIAEDPKAADRLASLEATRGQEIAAQAQAEIARLEQQGLTQRTNITEVNQSVREEIAKGVSWYHWRHLGQYVVPLMGFVMTVGLAKSMFWGTPNAVELSQLVTAVVPVLAIIAGLGGYVAMDSTNLKQTAITGERGSSLLNTAKAAMVGKKP